MASSKAKKISIFFIALVILIAFLAITKVFMIRAEIAKYAAMTPKPPTISTVKVEPLAYQNSDTAVGTFKAINGVNVTPQASGEVVKKLVNSGQVVQQGQPIIQLDDRSAKTTLANDQAAFQNAAINLQRDQRLIKVHAISQSQFDTDIAAYKQAKAAMAGAAVALSNLTVTAPFAGKLGIMQVDIGQYVNPGEAIVSLQTQDPIHFNFNLPESDLANLVLGSNLYLKVDRFPNKSFVGQITAIDSTIDPATHTIAVQGTFPNKEHLLFPGGFATAKVYLGKKMQVLGIPNTAVTYRLYGDSVYIVTSSTKDGNVVNTATLKYIQVGNPIDDNYVAVSGGLKQGDLVVTAGQNKLQEQNVVLIDNKMPKTDNPLKQLS